MASIPPPGASSRIRRWRPELVRRTSLARDDAGPTAPVSRDDRPDGVDDLQRLDPELMRRRWRSVMGRPAPPHLSANLMIRILVWREQVARGGGLDQTTRAAL